MHRPSILKPEETYTFSRYFELTFDSEDILAELGCTLKRHPIPPAQDLKGIDTTSLRKRLEESLLYVDLTSEAARREVLIAPILLEICRLFQVKLKIEYPIAVNDKLKGTLDYYLQAHGQFLVVEAKNADLARGFTQLAVELIALDQWIDSDTSTLYGAVTTGDIWRFAQFQRQDREVQQDTNLYRVPADLDTVIQILISVLSS